MGRPSEHDPRYPIGRFEQPAVISVEARRAALRDLAELPELLRHGLDRLNDHQLNTPYRDGGWTVRQLVHHIADSHMNAFIRVRMALTEDSPMIAAYDERGWAELHDAKVAPVEWSLELIESLHARWVMMLQGLSEGQWQRPFRHPESGVQTVEGATLSYAWHSRHHLAHITRLRADKGW